MSDSVTIPGASTSQITNIFSNPQSFVLAQQIADALEQASKDGKLDASDAPSFGDPIDPPPDNPGGINELVITLGGDYTIPAGSANAPDYVVVVDNEGPVTIRGAPNSTIWGGGGDVTIIDPALITIAEGSSGTAATVTLTGAGDILAGNDQNDVLTAAGIAQSISGGKGANLFFSLGANDTISAHGKGDTIVGSMGGSTFQLAPEANGALVFGGFGAATITDAGITDSIVASAGATNVTTSGAGSHVFGQAGALDIVDTGVNNFVVGSGGALTASLAGGQGAIFGGPGSLSVIDSGIGDTIVAGAGSTAITAPGGSFVFGTQGPLSFIGGTGGSTIAAGSGSSTITGGAGDTTLFGGAGGVVTYSNSTNGGLTYLALGGNETLDASLSTGAAQISGALDPTGQNLLKAGQGTDTLIAGSGADTMFGGGGNNLFVFFAQYGGAAPNDVIGDFSAIDTVLLADYGSNAAAIALAGATTSGGSTTITLSDNTKITFTGVTSSAALQNHVFST